MDPTDSRLLLALIDDPRGTVLSLAEKVGLSRNTVHARLARFDSERVIAGFERRIDPRTLGYPISALITVTLVQQHLDEVGAALAEIPEVLEVYGVSGGADLVVQVAARNADDLYRVAGMILATPAVERTETSLIMRKLVDYRVQPLLERLAERKSR